ncbi:D-alanyl-D-alanine carboxypeptidase family protein [Streptomyces katsurahamanus]|uniref:D-alanyl-D-alanine carboxypeptidase n=1 Tax=Streptomyces katsurahamanus TaxID=2577098 RepID=A0ABW9P0B5_9ACTN|nr:serine hydrolase [Streptomyces katsurahamanus]MQS39015.1 D-alanyl-D-alanine carboxypeptidase [Streptomyces katsurahamanus]
MSADHSNRSGAGTGSGSGSDSRTGSGTGSRSDSGAGVRPVAARFGLRFRFRLRLRRSVLVPLSAAAVVLVTGTGGWYAVGGGGQPGPGGTPLAPADPTAPLAPAAKEMDLPWPAEGQSSVEVEGIGSLGVVGEQTPVPIASVTKVMTAYVILKNHPLRPGAAGAKIVADQRAADESFSTVETTAPVLAGREYTQRRLLELMMLPSGNNVARLLARWDAGGQKKFVGKMNEAAAALGMNRTVYTGVSGMEASTKSTAVDQLKLARAVMKDPAFRQVVATRAVTAPGAGTEIRNTNRLLGRDGVIGLKTGTTTPAGGNFMWAATQKIAGTSRLILGVVLHQRAGTSPVEGSTAVREASHALITAIRADLPDAVARHAAREK